MAGFDFSQISDEQLEATVDALMHDPIALRTTPVAQRQATIDEYNRRKAARNAKPAPAPAAPVAAAPVAPNVEANLEASASPIVADPEPDVGTPRYSRATPGDHVARAREIMAENPGMSAKEAAALAAREQIRSQYKEMEENRPEGGYPMGRWGDEYYAATGAPAKPAAEEPVAGDYYDGLVVTAEDVDRMSDKQIVHNMRHTGAGAGYNDYQTYTPQEIATHRAWMKDVNRIPGGRDQERFNPRGYAAARQKYEQGIRDRANKQMEDEGFGPNRSPKQQANLQARKDAEAQRAARPRAVDAMLGRMAERAGVSMEEAQQAWDAAVAASDGEIKVEDGLTPDEIFKGTKALRDKAKTRQAAGRQSQRDKIALRREVRYNPVAALGDDSGLNDWQKMVVADGMLRGGQQGPTPLGVQAMDMQNAGTVIQRFLTGGAAGMINNPIATASAQQQQVQQQQDAVKWAEDNVNENYAWDATSWFGSEFTNEEYQQAIDDLMVRFGPPAGKMTLAEATRIVDSIAAKKRRPAAAPAAVPAGGVVPGSVPAV